MARRARRNVPGASMNAKLDLEALENAIDATAGLSGISKNCAEARLVGQILKMMRVLETGGEDDCLAAIKWLFRKWDAPRFGVQFRDTGALVAVCAASRRSEPNVRLQAVKLLGVLGAYATRTRGTSSWRHWRAWCEAEAGKALLDATTDQIPLIRAAAVRAARMLTELREHYAAKSNPKKSKGDRRRRRKAQQQKRSAVRSGRRPTQNDLQHYLGFVLYALMGRMNEADDILIAHGSSVKKMAAWLRGLQPLPLAPVLYRGILLNNLPASGPLPPDPRKAPYMSMAEDKDVACWFGNPHSSISNVAEFGQVSLGKHGVVVAMPSGPLHDRVLWHHAWQAIPDPTKPGALINLRTTAMHNFGAFGKAIVWALDTQKEVMVESRPGESLPFVRVEDAGCPPLAVLERKLGS